MSHPNRRRFLAESILAATAASAGSVRSALAGQPPSRSANERLRIAVIGAGIRGPVHARAFAGREDCEVTAICDADGTRAHRLAENVEKIQGRKPEAVQDLRRILDDPAVNCVSIATCNHWHALCAIWAMQRGKDVYVEKPASHTISEGRRMVRAAHKHRRIRQVGTQYRSDGTCRAAVQYMARGKLGKITLARSITYKRRRSIGPPVQGKVPPGVDYNLWAGPAPTSPVTRRNFHYDWHWFWETGNGDVGNSDVHRTDLVRWGLGLTRLSRSVMCYGGRLGYRDAAATPNTQIVVHDLGGTTFVQEVRGLETPRFHRHGGAIFAGSEGYIGMVAGGSALFDPQGKKIRDFSGPGDDHFANFIEAVRSRRPEDLNAEISGGHLSAGLCHLGNISYRLGRAASPDEILAQLGGRKLNDDPGETFRRTREHLAANGVDVEKTPLTLGPWLDFEPEKGTFVDNPDADALLTRRYRKPFVVPAEDKL